jgi:hypothetical protein
MAQINPRTFADAKQLADGVYELILTNWGNRGQAQDLDNGSIQYPPIKSLPNGAIPIVPLPGTGDFLLPPIPSLSAIAIAPRSTVDRCIIHYASLQQASASLHVNAFDGLFLPCTIEQGFVNKGGILESEQELSVGAPLVGQQSGPVIVRAHRDTWFSDVYFPLVGGGPFGLPFGTAIDKSYIIDANGGNVGAWVNPTLRLLLYLNGATALPPLRRAPFRDVFDCRPPATSEIMRVVPIIGRRRVQVTIDALASSVTFQITGCTQAQFPASNTGPTFVNFEIQEVNLAGPVLITGGTQQIFTFDQPGLTFMIIRGSSGFITSSTRVIIDAYD